MNPTPNTSQDKLDELLERIFEGYYAMGGLTQDEAKAALIQWRNEWALELIGEDEVINHEYDHIGNIKEISYLYTPYMVARNYFRAELRRAMEGETK